MVQDRNNGVKHCPFCKTEMMFHHSMVSHSLYDKKEGIGIYARDESFKCPRCYFFCTFGVPISKETYEKYLKAHGGQFEYSKPEKLDWNKDMKKRLVALGYLDVDK